MDLVPIGADDFELWAEGVRNRLAAPRVDTRAWPASSALTRAGELMARLLPDGLATPGHHVYAARHGAAAVGSVWMRIEGPDAFIFDLDAAASPPTTLPPEVSSPTALLAESSPSAALLAESSPVTTLLAAASEAASALGASVLRLNVFGSDTALRAAVGDFEVSVSQMRLWIDRHDPAVDDESTDISLRDMSADEFALFLPIQEAEYADGLFRSRLARSIDEARVRAIAENDESLPDGVGSDGQVLQTAWADGTAVGYIWWELSDGATGPYAFVNDLFVHPQFRRRGYGRAIMLAAERDCRERGVVVLGLSVFGFNDGARALYERIGYEITEQMVWRDLPSSDALPPSHARAATV